MENPLLIGVFPGLRETEHTFDYLGVAVFPLSIGAAPTAGILPVPPPLQPVLPGGLRRGGEVAVEDADLPLLLALAAGAAGSALWAVVGLPQLGGLAAADAGLDLDRGLWVDAPGDQWAQTVAVVAESVPVVLLGSPGRVPERTGRRLSAVLRRTGAVLLVAGPWEGAAVRLRVGRSAWEGVGSGHGLLQRRRVEVHGWGRGAASAGSSTVVWLPGPDGQIAAVQRPAEQGGRRLTGIAGTG